MPTGKPITVVRDKLSGKSVKAQRYDPPKGAWSPIGEYENSGDRGFEAAPKGEKDDWVLVLKDTAKKYPTERGK